MFAWFNVWKTLSSHRIDMVSLVAAQEKTGLVLLSRQCLLGLVVEKDAKDDESRAKPAHYRPRIGEEQNGQPDEHGSLDRVCHTVDKDQKVLGNVIYTF